MACCRRNKFITPYPASPSGLRVSGGHLCEAEATTEPGGEKSCHEERVTDEGQIIKWITDRRGNLSVQDHLSVFSVSYQITVYVQNLK